MSGLDKSLSEYYDAHKNTRQDGKIKHRNKTDTEKVEKPKTLHKKSGETIGSDTHMKKSGKHISHKRKDDNTPDERYRDNKDVVGERPKGARGSAPPDTPKERAKKAEIERLKKADADKAKKHRPVENPAKSKPTGDTKPETKPTSQSKPQSKPETKPTTQPQTTSTPQSNTAPKSEPKKEPKNNPKQDTKKVPDTKGDDSKKKDGVLSKAGKAVGKKIGDARKKAGNASKEAGKDVGRSVADGVETVYNRLNNKDHIKK